MLQGKRRNLMTIWVMFVPLSKARSSEGCGQGGTHSRCLQERQLLPHWPSTWHLASDGMRFCVIGRAALDKEPMIEKRGCSQSTLGPQQDTEL